MTSPEFTRPGRGEVRGEAKRRAGDLDPKGRKCAIISICRICVDQLLLFFFFFFRALQGAAKITGLLFSSEEQKKAGP